MTKRELFIKSTCFTTIGKLEDRELACGKFQSPISPDNFLFYIIELNSNYPNSKVIKKTVQILQNHCKTAGDEITEENFEKILQGINEGLARLTESGENSWLGNLNAIIGLVSNNEILLTQTGNVTGYIFRKNKISSITERNPDKNLHPLKTFVEITSGQIMDNDHMIFGNFDLFNRISLDRIRTIAQEDNYYHETTELFQILRKNKAFDVNAIFIGASEIDQKNPEIDSSDILYIDAPDETIKKFIDKYVAPTSKIIYDFAIKATKSGAKQVKILSKNSKEYWDKNIAPKSKELLKEGSKKIANRISNTQVKFPEFNTSFNEQNGGIKIKSNSYLHSKKDSPVSSFFTSFIDILKNFRLLLLPQNRKYLYGILIIILISFSFLKLKENNDKRTQQAKAVELQNSYDEANSTFSKIKEDIALGRTVDNKQLTDVLALAQSASQVQANRDKANALVKDIEALLDDRTKTVRIATTKISGFQSNLASIALSGNMIYGINNNGKIYSLDTRDTASSKLIAALDQNSGTPVATNISTSNNTLLITTSTKRLFSMNLDSNTISELKISATPSEWSASNSIATYSTNIYLLSSDNGVVWKHTVKTDGTYAKGTSYLDTKTKSIQGAVDFAIDGNLYILGNDGYVSKFVKGELEPDFSIKGIPAPDSSILAPKKIFTDENTNSIFVLDKKYDRVIKFDKSGNFSDQYILDGKPIDNFVVNAKLQKIWFLSGGQIFEGNL